MRQTALAPELDLPRIDDTPADVAALRAEERLVVLASCGAHDAADRRAARARLVAAGLDWHRVARIATENRVLAAVVRELADEPGVPAGTRRALGMAALRMEHAAARRRREFERLLPAVLAEHEIILLRGIAYAYTLHADRFVRPIGDVDLLIRTPPAVASLSGRLNDHYHVSRAVLAHPGGEYVEYHHDFNVVGGLRVARMDMQALWARRRALTVGGCRVAVLGPEDDFVYLAFHNVIKGFTGLYRFVDLLALARRGIRWELVVASARRYGVGGSVWLSCHVLGLLAPGVVPAGVAASLRPARWAARLALRLFTLDLVLHDPNPALGRERAGAAANRRKQALRTLLLVAGGNWRRLPALLAGSLVHRLLRGYARLYELRGARRVLRAARAALQGE